MRVRRILSRNGICLVILAVVCVALVWQPMVQAQVKPGAPADKPGGAAGAADTSKDGPVKGQGIVTAFSLQNRMIEIDHAPYILSKDLVIKGKNDKVIQGYNLEYLSIVYRVGFVRIKQRITEITILEYTS